MDIQTQQHLRAALDAAFDSDVSNELYQLHTVEPTLQEAILPIVIWKPDDTLCWWGTAFAIAHYGGWVIMVTARHVIRDYQAKYPYEIGKVIGQYVLLEPEPGRSSTRPAGDRWPGDVLPLQGATYLQPTYEHDREESFDPPTAGAAPADLAVFPWIGMVRTVPLLRL